MQFGNSGVDLRKPEHLEKVRQVFRAANQLRMPIVAHLWTNPEYETEGGQHAKIFLEQLLPEAPDITIQIAHLAGGGRSTDVALAVFADATAANNPLTKNLYFDVATSTVGQSKAGLQKDADWMRQIGLKLYPLRHRRLSAQSVTVSILGKLQRPDAFDRCGIQDHRDQRRTLSPLRACEFRTI